MVVGELQRIDDPQDFIEVAAGAGGIGDLQTQLLGRVDHEHRAHREVVERLRVNHPVEVTHGLVFIGQDWVINDRALGFVDVADPALVTLSRVNAQGDGFDVALIPFGPQLGDGTCLLYTSPSPRDGLLSRMPSSA